VDETVRFVGTRAGAAFARLFQLGGLEREGYVGLGLAGRSGADFVATGFETLPGDWRPDELDPRTPWVEGATPLAHRDSWVFPWYVAHHPDGVDECVLVRLLEPLVLHEPSMGSDPTRAGRALRAGHYVLGPGSSPGAGLGIALWVRPGTVAAAEATTVLTRNVTPQSLAELAQEVLQ
jgi:hypothetical protein